MSSEKKFKTKTGYCHILNDKIVLTRDGIIGNISEYTSGSKIYRLLVIYSIIAGILFYCAYLNYPRNLFLVGLLSSMGCLLIFNVFNSFNLSATPIIFRSRIKNIKFKKGITGLIRSRFIIHFEDENGKRKKRFIMLPGSLSNGKDETQNALSIMHEEKLIK